MSYPQIVRHDRADQTGVVAERGPNDRRRLAEEGLNGGTLTERHDQEIACAADSATDRDKLRIKNVDIGCKRVCEIVNVKPESVTVAFKANEMDSWYNAGISAVELEQQGRERNFLPRIVVEWLAGRSAETRDALAVRVTEDVSEIVKVKPESVTVVFKVNERDNWYKSGISAVEIGRRRAEKQGK